MQIYTGWARRSPSGLASSTNSSIFRTQSNSQFRLFWLTHPCQAIYMAVQSFPREGDPRGQPLDADRTRRRDEHETAGGDRQVYGDGSTDLQRPYRQDAAYLLAAQHH